MKQEVLVLGRFQPFHNGHLAIVKQFLKKGYKVLIGLGGPKQQEDSELFSATERTEMISRVIEAAKLSDVEIIEIPNIYDDSHYVKHVEKHLGRKPALIFSGNPWVYELFETEGYEIETFDEEIDRIKNISSTKIRKLICEDGNWEDLVPKEITEYIKQTKSEEKVKKFCKLN